MDITAAITKLLFLYIVPIHAGVLKKSPGDYPGKYRRLNCLQLEGKVLTNLKTWRFSICP
jgi:hypothetical protein